MSSFSRYLILVSLISIFTAKCYSENCLNSALPFYGEINISYDHFRGPSDGSWNGNNGGIIGANFGIDAFNIAGLQLGGSYGVYDWYGRGAVVSKNSGSIQSQAFVTGGFSYETPFCSGLQGGVVVDWMFNKNFSVFAVNPNFGQIRLQSGYLINGEDEVGLWGTIDFGTSHKNVFEIPVSYRAISQVNLFWRHFFENYAETMLWIGLPYKKSLMFNGKRAGQYIVGGSFQVPLTHNLSIVGHGMYMGPSSKNSVSRFQNDAVNICIGLNLSFGTAAECSSNAWHTRPYLPVANNSNFIVDTSLSN